MYRFYIIERFYCIRMVYLMLLLIIFSNFGGIWTFTFFTIWFYSFFSLFRIILVKSNIILFIKLFILKCLVTIYLCTYSFFNHHCFFNGTLLYFRNGILI